MLPRGCGIARCTRAGDSVRLNTAFKTVVAFATLLVASCAAVEPPREKKLAGKWQTKNPRATAEYVFRDDGTFSGRVTADGRVVANFTGKWSLTEDAILYEYLTDTAGTIDPGTRDRDKLLSLERDHFVIEARDGSRRTYTRVR